MVVGLLMFGEIDLVDALLLGLRIRGTCRRAFGNHTRIARIDAFHLAISTVLLRIGDKEAGFKPPILQGLDTITLRAVAICDLEDIAYLALKAPVRQCLRRA